MPDTKSPEAIARLEARIAELTRERDEAMSSFYPMKLDRDDWKKDAYLTTEKLVATKAALQSERDQLAAAVAAEREKVAAFMLQHSFATGHGDTLDDLLAELGPEISRKVAAARAEAIEAAAIEAERELPLWAPEHGGHHSIDAGRQMAGRIIAAAIRSIPPPKKI